MIRVMHDEHAFSDLLLSHLLSRSMQIQADLVDQLFNSSEKRLARILLLMAEFGKPGEPEQYIPKISQETLAEMIGTTRSRVSFFMNRFRKLGFIEYHGRIKVHRLLLNAILLDQMPERNPENIKVRPDHEVPQRRPAACSEFGSPPAASHLHQLSVDKPPRFQIDGRVGASSGSPLNA